METVEVCKQYLGKGVVGIDLAGAEGFVPLSNFGPLFAKAKEYGLPMTCHAGDSQRLRYSQKDDWVLLRALMLMKDRC